MKRMNLRDVPDDVYASLIEAADDHRQSLSAFVVDRLVEISRTARLSEYVDSYPAPDGTDVSLRQAADAVREVREAS